MIGLVLRLLAWMRQWSESPLERDLREAREKRLARAKIRLPGE